MSPPASNFYVIKFKDTIPQGITDYTVITNSWIRCHIHKEKTVAVSYPTEQIQKTIKRVRNRENYSKKWDIYPANIEFGADTFEEVKDYLKHLNQNFNIQKPAPVKRKLSVTSDDVALNKLAKTYEVKSEKDIVTNSYDLTQTPDSPPPYQPPDNQQKSPELLKECHVPLISLKISNVKSERNKLMDDLSGACDSIRATLEDTVAMFDHVRTASDQIAKSFGQVLDIINKITTMSENNFKSNIPSPSMKIRKPEHKLAKHVIKRGVGRPRKYALPPEYNALDPKWTLRHQKASPGVVELMPHTEVFVSEAGLAACQSQATDQRTYCCKLLKEIFTDQALSTCSLTGSKPKDPAKRGAFVRPGLSKHARMVLLAHIQEYAREAGWPQFELPTLWVAVRNIMAKRRQGKLPKRRAPVKEKSRENSPQTD